MIARLARFGAVGLSGSVLNLSLFWLLTSFGSVHHLLAAAMAFEAALCSNYVLNQYWTFADRHAGRAGLLCYQVSGLGGLAISLAALNLLTAVGVLPVVAQALGIAAAMIWNFALSLGWTWRAPSALQPV